jgi:SAM-dependent methyltransferase
MGVQAGGGGQVTVPDWIARHRAAWAAKPALSGWYAREIFARVDAALVPGRTLQLGCGPGFYGARRPGFVNVDLGSQDGVDAACDVHALPFAPASFANVVGIDVLHHFEAPGRALREIARVLAPGGACLLVEPWAGAFGYLVYRFLHHEDCRAVAAPWRAAFGPGKDALDGNAWIPRALLWRRADELAREAPGLVPEKLETFGALGYLATGGFGAFGAPDGLVRALAAAEALLPQAAMRHAALRAFFVLRRTGAGAGAPT